MSAGDAADPKQPLQDATERHAKLASNMRKLKARHQAALREIAFLRARLAEAEPHAPAPSILQGITARRPKLVEHAGRVTLWKTAREKLLWSGLSAEQALDLECLCLERLAEVTGDTRPHFPQLIAVKPEDLSFEITHQGKTVRDLRANGRSCVIPALEDQIARIVAQLQAARVIHLDMHPDGRNVALSSDGYVSLIDFDIAACDEVPFSGAIAERMAEFHSEGGYGASAQRLREILVPVRL